MTLTLDLPPETEHKLRQRAAASGQDVIAYVHQLIERDLQDGAAERNGSGMGIPEAVPPPKPTLEEILAPIREEFERSGMTEEELEQLLVEARDEVRREKRARRGG